MIIYIFLLSIIIIFLFKLPYLDKNKKLLIIFVLFWIVSSIRSIQIGNDTKAYYTLFINADKANYFEIFSSRYEIGYLVLNRVIREITNNFTIFLFFINGFIYFSFYKFIKFYSKNYMVSCLIFLLFCFFPQTMNVIRLSLAISLTMLSSICKEKNRTARSLFLAALAVFFQRISFVYLMTFFIHKRNKKNIIMFGGIITIIFWFLMNDILILIGKLIPYYAGYLSSNSLYQIGDVKLASILQLLLQVIILIFTYIIFKKKQTVMSNKDLDLYMNSMIMIFIAVCITFLSLKFNLIDRCSNIFWIYSIVLLPNAYLKLNRTNRNTALILTLCLGIAYFSTVTIVKKDWNNIYPYETFSENIKYIS